MLDVRLSGGLQLRVDGAPISLPASRRARAVLAFLALNPGTQPRARVAARFWPDVLDESARASLRVALTELRQALGPAAGYVVATRDTVALEGADLTVEIREFDRALAHGDVTRALAACDAPILEDFEEEWAIEARDEHARQLAGALERAAAAASDPTEAIRLTRAEVALDPLAEAPNRRLIERLAASGDRGAALSAGRQFAERLRTQLGIAPSHETRSLIEDLRRHQTEPVPAPLALTRSHDTAFVGRRAELARLRACWGGVQMHRDRRIALIAGEPGVGKTRLAQQFAAAAVEEGAIVLLGRCSEEPLAPFEPYAEALSQAGVAGALEPGGGIEDTGARHRLFDAVDAALTDLAARNPLLLVIDDLHWPIAAACCSPGFCCALAARDRS
jgi:DNA-binding SARP family transcriptional activator